MRARGRQSTFDPETGGCTGDEAPLPAGDYVVQAVLPDGYQVVKEEDINTSEGDTIVPQVPPPPCVGDPHDVPSTTRDRTPASRGRCATSGWSRSTTARTRPSDFFLFTDNEVPIPGRIVGLILNDVRFEVDPGNPLYGEGQGEKMPVGVYDYADRLITTVNSDENGAYEVLLPSTYTASCPTPSGVCPGMYKLDDQRPGHEGEPEPGIQPERDRPDAGDGRLARQDDVRGHAGRSRAARRRCNDYTGPEIFQVSQGAHADERHRARRRSFVILGRNFGASPDRDARRGADQRRPATRPVPTAPGS